MLILQSPFFMIAWEFPHRDSDLRYAKPLYLFFFPRRNFWKKLLPLFEPNIDSKCCIRNAQEELRHANWHRSGIRIRVNTRSLLVFFTSSLLVNTLGVVVERPSSETPNTGQRWVFSGMTNITYWIKKNADVFRGKGEHTHNPAASTSIEEHNKGWNTEVHNSCFRLKRSPLRWWWHRRLLLNSRYTANTGATYFPHPPRINTLELAPFFSNSCGK